MNKAIGLIDGNNFYASCEQVINPSLEGKPVVVLSNNDGCIISRNPEARQLNIKMGEPYFKISHKLERLGVKVFSSNYALYGDMSQRLMNIIKSNCEELEIYSIDEAFIQLTRPKGYQLRSWSHQLRAEIYRNLGLSIAIGIGSNKVQAKIANYLAKNIENNAGIFDLGTTSDQDKWLETIDIENIWGVGNQLAHWCRCKGIKTARQFRDMPSYKLKSKFGVVGIRIQEEIRGHSCLFLKTTKKPKKETCVSKSIKIPITRKEDLNKLIANHVVIASRKLREQKQIARKITIFARTSPYSPNLYSQSASKRLEIPTNNTNLILKASLSLTKEIYRSGFLIIKSGVIMQDLQSIDYLQLNLNEEMKTEKLKKQDDLMKIIDRINNKYGHNTITWCACDIKNNLSIRREKLSHASTTKYNRIPTAKAS